MTNSVNILIVGSEACAQALALKFKSQNSGAKIYVAPGNGLENDCYENVDIRPNDATALLKFALEKGISLTVLISELALKSDVALFFTANNQNVFAPSKDACIPIINKILNKKFLYKIHAQTPKFGIFDKLTQAQNYVQTANYPIIIRAAENGMEDDRQICPSVSLANKYLSDVMINRCESDVLIEEFYYGHNFTIYFITDGYGIAPIVSVNNYKFTNSDKSGFYTSGVGCSAPDYKISNDLILKVRNVVVSALKNLEYKQTPYMGIIGVDCTLTCENKFVVNEFVPFFRNCDAHAVLNLIEDNIYEIFTSCVNGSFSDEYEEIKTNDKYSVSVVVRAKYEEQIIPSVSNDNICYSSIKQENGVLSTKKGEVFTITHSSATLNNAKRAIKEDLTDIAFKGMNFRSDIISQCDY